MLDNDQNTAISLKSNESREITTKTQALDDPLILLNDIYRYALGRLGSKEDAEDATMEAFIAVHSAPHRWRKAREPKLYLFGIASRKVADILRRRRRLPEETPNSVEPDLNQRQAIEQVLGRLPDSQREVLILKYLYEFSTGDIAQIVRKSPLAVNSLLQRAREGFRYEAGEGFVESMSR
jgi:RNA polymerase sigma-70 factor (ECF subfamily)